MKTITPFLIFFSFSICLLGQSGKATGYQYTVDLTRVVDDKLFVELSTPAITTAEVIFYLPKIVPGTYAIADYGRFVSEFKALDKNGKELPVEKLDVNSWKIKNASKAKKITYWVEDTFDTTIPDPTIFQPAGTNIEADKNFIINTSGFFGYLDGIKDRPYKFTIIRDQGFYGSTGLIAERTGDPLPKVKIEKGQPDNSQKRMDVYQVDDYDRLIDSPLMYSKPDTAIIRVGNTEVLIGSYSPNGKISAKEIANSVRDILMAQKEFLGGNLPVNKYAFVFYFTDQPVIQYGALEHSYSSVYYMPETTIQQMDNQLRDFAAHEFFHIVTPLNIHSEEIHRFGFNDPKMSKHLWLYEGVTEYFANLVQVKHDLIPSEDFLNRLQQKMTTADHFIDDVAFTNISKNILEQYENQFYNVYQKGALIAMCLDIQLRNLSHGTYGLQNLMADLSKKYGKAQAFKDDELFTEIGKLTYPEIGNFLNRYVGGSESLPLAEVFDLVGITYKKEASFQELSLGLESAAIKVSQYNEKPRFAIRDASLLNEQGRLIGLQSEDILLKVNGKTIPDLGQGTQTFFNEQKLSLVEGQKLTFTVARKNGEAFNEIELNSTVKKVERIKKHLIELDLQATPDKIKIREAWWKASH